MGAPYLDHEKLFSRLSEHPFSLPAKTKVGIDWQNACDKVEDEYFIALTPPKAAGKDCVITIDEKLLVRHLFAPTEPVLTLNIFELINFKDDPEVALRFAKVIDARLQKQSFTTRLVDEEILRESIFTIKLDSFESLANSRAKFKVEIPSCNYSSTTDERFPLGELLSRDVLKRIWDDCYSSGVDFKVFT